MKQYVDITTLRYDEENDEYYIVSNLFEKAGFKEGDTLNWSDNGDGSWSLTKIKEENNKND